MRDPFMSEGVCYDRLAKEYSKHPKLIVAVDFDDTVFDFHKRGQTHDLVINLLKRCKKLGFYIVLFSASDPVRYPEMNKYLKDNGIVVDSINSNPIELPYGNNGKIYYNILLDDRAGLGQAYNVLDELVTRIELGEHLD